MVNQMSRLTIAMTDQQQQGLGALSSPQGKTIQECAIERLIPQASQEQRVRPALETLLKQRIAEAHRGDVDERRFIEIADVVLKSEPTCA